MADVRLAEVPVMRNDGYRATRALMTGPRPPTAILALSDVLPPPREFPLASHVTRVWWAV